MFKSIAISLLAAAGGLVAWPAIFAVVFYAPVSLGFVKEREMVGMGWISGFAGFVLASILVLIMFLLFLRWHLAKASNDENRALRLKVVVITAVVAFIGVQYSGLVSALMAFFLKSLAS